MQSSKQWNIKIKCVLLQGEARAEAGAGADAGAEAGADAGAGPENLFFIWYTLFNIWYLKCYMIYNIIIL